MVANKITFQVKILLWGSIINSSLKRNFRKKSGKAQNCLKINKKKFLKFGGKKSDFFSIKILGLGINLYSEFSRLKIKFY